MFRLFKRSEEKELVKAYKEFYKKKMRLVREWSKKKVKLKESGGEEELIDYITNKLIEKKMEREKPLFLR